MTKIFIKRVDLARHLFDYLVLGTTNNNEGEINGIKYRLESLGETRSGKWTIVRVLQTYPTDSDDILIASLISALDLMMIDLGWIKNYIVERPVVRDLYGRDFPYCDVRIAF